VSLDRPGIALSAKGYAYGLLPGTYVYTHAPDASDNREFLMEVVRRPFLSDIFPKLSSDDQRDLSLAIAIMLAEAVPFNGQAEDFARIERLVPPGFDTEFYYQVGVRAMDRHPSELPKAVAAVEFVRHRTPAMHQLAVAGIYRQWPKQAALDRPPESLVNAPAAVSPDLAPHYWRAIGYLAGRYWYDTERSLSLLKTHLHEFVPRLEPSVQRWFLQGVGEFLFTRLIDAPWIPRAELERFPQAYQAGLLEGWGMALGEEEFSDPLPWKGPKSLAWVAATKNFSARSLVSVQQGKAQFDVLVAGSASLAPKPLRHAP
jgi:hypothetical protein